MSQGEDIVGVELLPCPNPWCIARTPPLPCALKREGWAVRCECGIVTLRRSTEAEARALWNTRTLTPEPSAAVDLEGVARVTKWLDDDPDHDILPFDGDHSCATIGDIRSIIRAALTPMTPLVLDREAVARIVDPKGWEYHDDHLERANMWEAEGFPSDHALVGGYRNGAAYNVKDSLTKADSIIALTSQAGGLDGWQDIASAPYDTAVDVRVGSMTLRARLLHNHAEDENGSCDQWVAEIEGEHPPCWTGGACWESNEDEVISLQPSAWHPVPAIRASNPSVGGKA